MLTMMLGPLAGRTARVEGQVSPGPLARAHADLEGTLNCTKCHGGGRDAMPARCTGCHQDITWLMERGRGLHGRPENRTQPCAACHPDHAGRDFQLVKWPTGSPDKFEHGQAGWSLRQSHADLACVKCHTPSLRASPAARLSALKRVGGWTGLESTCKACHEDIHRGALGQDCTRCHDAGRWTRTPGFNHDTTAFPLTEKHITVPCDRCHAAGRLTPKQDNAGHLVPVYKPVAHGACTNCHEDAHRGQFGVLCANCHTTAGWRRVDKSRFDHDRTAYPLRGRHATTPCASCHGDFSTPERKKPSSRTCGTCHKDVHNRTATLAGRVVECDQCHQVSGFSPASFTVAQHSRAKYALEGKHQSVTCTACHRKDTGTAGAERWGSSRVVLRPAFGACRDCHSDLHGGQLSTRVNQDCSSCHRVAGWRPSTFDGTAHAALRLPLEGRHAEVECKSCHGPGRAGLPALPAVPLGKAAFYFKLPEVTCTACHRDPHNGRFTAGGVLAQPKGCLACHDTRAFRPSTTDIAVHATLGFPLEGAHRATACVSCHAEMKPGAPARSSLIGVKAPDRQLRYESSKSACADCHQTPHGTQFDSRADGGRCGSCHGTDRFTPASRFDHNRDAAFTLKGAHQAVPCNQCHPTDLKGGTAKALIYHPVSSKCETCHGGAAR